MKEKKVLFGGNTILSFCLGHEKLSPMKCGMNSKRETIHKQLNV